MTNENPRRSPFPRAALAAALCLASLLPAAVAAGAPTAKAPAPAAAPAVEAAPFFYALSVRSAAASAEWYARVLGFAETRREAMPEHGVTIVLMSRPDAVLEIVEMASSRSPADLEPPVESAGLPRGVFKFGFLVDDLDVAQRRLAALGVPLRGRVITERDGSFRSLQVEDPDGNVIQIFQRLGGAQR